jgi:tripartite-type tricarboxylate transporter receptor subunit TctC
MTMTRRNLLVAAAPLLGWGGALAQAVYPNRPIKVVAPFTAGAAADTLLRRVTEAAGKLLGQALVVDNKPGAQAAIAARIVARAAPDGYTLMMGGNSSHAANVHTLKNPGYDPLADFTPITQLSLNPLMLVVPASLPVRTVQEFIQYARDRPGKLSYATGNSGMLVAAKLLTTQAGIDALAVNYAGAAPATTDLLGGRIDFIMNDPVVAAPFVKTGQLRVLGVTSRQRIPLFPDVAPLAEQGLPDYDYASWSAMFGPAGLPADMVNKLQQVFAQVMADPAMQAFAASAGILPQTSSPAQLRAFVQEQIGLWGRWTRVAGLAPE